jgi:putative ABC transport system permease protein
LTESFREKTDAFDLYIMAVEIVDDEDFDKILEENGLSKSS